MPTGAHPFVATTVGTTSPFAVLYFFVIVVLVLYGSYWAANKSRTASEFYAGARKPNPFQNGLALAGDYMSAASFLGIAGLCALHGREGLIYATGFFVGWPLLLFLAAEPLRNLGRFACADAIAFRLKSGPVRAASAVGGILTIFFYLAAQMVGSGYLIASLFSVSYEAAEVIVGVVLLVYVLFGGVLATTWVQIVKAVLLLAGVTLLAVAVLARFHFSPGDLFAEIGRQYGAGALDAGNRVKDPIETLSLGLALMFGLLGLPHVLTRFFTLPDAKAARVSVVCATGFIGYFYCVIPIVGLGAGVLITGGGPTPTSDLGRSLLASMDAGGNLAAPLLAGRLGGALFLGFVAAVAFATILTVLGGLTLSGAFSFSHDLCAQGFRGGKATGDEELSTTRKATAAFSVAAVVLGLVFRGQNAAFLVGLAFAVACSANVPALLLSILWRKFTTPAAVCSILTGAFLSVGLIVVSPTVWGEVLGHVGPDGRPAGLIALRNPAIVSMTAAFLVGVLVSLITKEPAAEELFDDQKLRTYLGVGAE